MCTPIEITIWDHDIERIADIDRNLHRALRKIGRRCQILCMSEPPMLARKGVLHSAPVLEIDGNLWSLKPGDNITEADCDSLVSIIFPSQDEGSD